MFLVLNDALIFVGRCVVKHQTKKQKKVKSALQKTMTSGLNLRSKIYLKYEN